MRRPWGAHGWQWGLSPCCFRGCVPYSSSLEVYLTVRASSPSRFSFPWVHSLLQLDGAASIVLDTSSWVFRAQLTKHVKRKFLHRITWCEKVPLGIKFGAYRSRWWMAQFKHSRVFLIPSKRLDCKKEIDEIPRKSAAAGSAAGFCALYTLGFSLSSILKCNLSAGANGSHSFFFFFPQSLWVLSLGQCGLDWCPDS